MSKWYKIERLKEILCSDDWTVLFADYISSLSKEELSSWIINMFSCDSDHCYTYMTEVFDEADENIVNDYYTRFVVNKS